jgi:hypothetical protein
MEWHPYSVTRELVVSLKANQEENVPRALADTGASSSIILGTFLSKDHIINGESSQTNWFTMGGHFTTNKKGLVTFLLPEFNLRKQISWTFHVNDWSKSSNTYDMIIGRDLHTE